MQAAILAVLLSGSLAAGVPDVGPETLDLSSLDEIVTRRPQESVWDAVPYQPARLDVAEPPRFYVTGLLGASFATLDDPLYSSIQSSAFNGTILTAGGAAGIAVPWDGGQVRFEVEGRGRDDLTRSFNQSLGPFARADFHWAAADGWSMLVNCWRDWSVGESLDVYAGGGAGAGGYRYSLDGDVNLFFPVGYESSLQATTFAWQAGGGVVYSLSDRVAFDMGYRFYALQAARSTYFVTLAGSTGPVAVLPQTFTAGELLFGLRIYEPFRRWD